MILNTVDMGQGVRPVVLLHGLFGAAQNFATLQKRMAATARVIALDLRNHGGSPHADSMTYEEMAGDVAETLRSVGALPCRLLGHSMGGKVAMRVALADPEAVERLIVADIAPVTYPPAFRSFAAAMQAVPLLPTLTRAAAGEALAAVIEDAGVRSFLLQNLRLGADPAWRIGLDEIAAALPGIESWDSPAGEVYNGPTLFLAGARSDYVRTEHRPAIRASFPQARFLALKDAGHWLHADNPEGFLSVVAGFFGLNGPG